MAPEATAVAAPAPVVAAPVVAAPVVAAPVVAPVAKPAEGAPAAKPDAPAPSKTILGGEPSSAAPAKDAPKTGAPEKYTDFKLPEGLKFDDALLGKFSETAKGLGLSQEGAQKIVDLQAQSVKAEIDARLSGFNKQVSDWGEASKKLFGTDFEKQFGLAAKAVERFGDADLKTLLRESGLGNHPAVIKAFNKIGALMSEDQPVDGRRAGGEAKTTAELMFDKMPAKK
jgi:hypothetical protein